MKTRKRNRSILAAGKQTDLITMPAAPVSIKAGMGPDGKPTAPTFEMDAYGGGAMSVEGWKFPVVVDLAGLDLTAKSRPILKDHDPAQPLGHTENITATGRLSATGVISGSGAYVDSVVAAAGKGFPWQASINARVVKNEFVPAGQIAKANGQTFDGPLNIARKSVLREISILSLGADDNTSTRIAAKAAEGTAMRFMVWAKARGLTADDLKNETILASAKALYKAQVPDGDAEDMTEPTPTPAAKPVKAKADGGTASDDEPGTAEDLVKELRAAAKTERQRQTQVTTLLDEYRKQVEPKKFADIEAKAIDGEFDLSRTELELIKARRPDIPVPNVNTGRGQEADGAIIAAAAARSIGVGEKAAFAGLDEKAGNIAASMRGLTMHAIIAASAARLGMHAHAGGIDDAFLGDFLRADRESHRQQLRSQQGTGGGIIRASSSAGFSTMSLTGITENIMNKAMLEQYGLQVSIVSDIAYERDTNDFKPFKVYRLTASGDFQPLGPGGELKNFSLQDESYSNQVSTKGALLVLKREDIINDDMGALMQSPQVLGRKAALNREKAVVTTFLSGLTTVAPGASTGKAANAFNFWSSGASNYLSGGSSALSITSLTTADTKFIQQTDANGDPIGLMPDRLFVCPELKATANNLFSGANLTVNALTLPSSSSGTSAAQTGSQVVNLNQHAGKYRPIVSPYLGGSSSVTGHSATQWALLGNPAGGMATVQVGYLRGQRTPIIRQVETDAIMLGIAFQAIYDFGVSLLDFRTGVYSAGA